MKKRRKKDAFDVVTFIIATLIVFVIELVIKIILFLFDLITFYTSEYKKKSGNGFFKTYFDKGNYGEFIFYRRLIRIFKKEQVLVNLYLENRNTEHTELDIVAVSEKGIYVFEVKNYRGWIYGSENNEYWTQVFHKNSKHKFYNPLRQNYAHTKSIENYINVASECLIPIVAFSNKCKLKKINISDKHFVYNYNYAIKLVKRIEKSGNNCFTNDEVTKYINLLTTKTNVDEEIKSQHVLDVMNLKESKLR